MLAQILHCPERLNLSEHFFHVSQSSACSLHDDEVFRAATAWSPSLALTLAVCCELAQWQRTRLFHHTDTRKSPHDISTDGADSGRGDSRERGRVAGSRCYGSRCGAVWTSLHGLAGYNDILRLQQEVA